MFIILANNMVKNEIQHMAVERTEGSFQTEVTTSVSLY